MNISFEPQSSPLDIPEVQDVYTMHPNYELLDIDPNGSQCFVYFAGHGLYHPNTSAVFRKQVIEGNRFEWRRNILPSAKRVILLRDVKKQWYLDGINASINTYQKLCEFITAGCMGLPVVCVGNSSGAYAAMLTGSMINAEKVFSFSGQFCLDQSWRKMSDPACNPVVARCLRDPKLSKFCSIHKATDGRSVPIYHFYSAYSDADKKDLQQSSGITFLRTIGFSTRSHARTCYACNFADIFAMSNKCLDVLCDSYKDRIARRISFSVRVSGLVKTLKYLSNRGILGKRP